MLGTILIISAVLLFIGALPRWSYSRQWGNYPSAGVVGLILTVLVILLLMGSF